jgi:hypothetical protein
VAVAVAVGVNVAVAVAVAVGVGVGAPVVEAENENTPLAPGFWVVNVHEPGVGVKPLPVIVPVPLTLRNPLPCWIMEDAVRLNVNPPTLQRAGSGPELKFQGAVIVTGAPTLTLAKDPDRLTTVGGWLFPLSQFVTRVAVLTEVVLRCAPPLMVMEPVIGATVAVAVGVGLGTGLVTSTYLESLGMPLVKTVTKAGPGGKLFTGTEVKEVSDQPAIASTGRKATWLLSMARS